jgi:hypothetical protein
MLRRVRQIARSTTILMQHQQPRYYIINKWKERKDVAENIYISHKENKVVLIQRTL